MANFPKIQKALYPHIPKIDPSIPYPFKYLQNIPYPFKFLANVPVSLKTLPGHRHCAICLNSTGSTQEDDQT